MFPSETDSVLEELRPAVPDSCAEEQEQERIHILDGGVHKVLDYQ